MNTEFRNKILNRYVDNAETENTQEREAYLQARENVAYAYPKAFELAKLVVGRAYPEEDVQTCKSLKAKYGQPLDVVANSQTTPELIRDPLCRSLILNAWWIWDQCCSCGN